MSDLTDRKIKGLEHDKRIWDNNGKLWVRQIEVVKLSKYKAIWTQTIELKPKDRKITLRSITWINKTFIFQLKDLWKKLPVVENSSHTLG